MRFVVLVFALAADLNKASLVFTEEVLLLISMDYAHRRINRLLGIRINCMLLFHAHHISELLYRFRLVHLLKDLVKKFVYH